MGQRLDLLYALQKGEAATEILVKELRQFSLWQLADTSRESEREKKKRMVFILLR
jgi:hypothetical protein